MPRFVPITHRVTFSALLAVAGGATALAMFVGLRGAGSRLLIGDEGWVIGFAFLGAFIAGLATADAFGRTGRAGWGALILGAMVATVIGAQLGGTLLFGNFEQGFYCVFVVVTSIVQYPITGFAWAALMVAVHGLTLVFVPKITARLDLVPSPDNL